MSGNLVFIMYRYCACNQCYHAAEMKQANPSRSIKRIVPSIRQYYLGLALVWVVSGLAESSL